MDIIYFFLPLLPGQVVLRCDRLWERGGAAGVGQVSGKGLKFLNSILKPITISVSFFNSHLPLPVVALERLRRQRSQQHRLLRGAVHAAGQYVRLDLGVKTHEFPLRKLIIFFPANAFSHLLEEQP